MEKIEDVVLRHSGRGMDILRREMNYDYAKKAGEMILSWKRGNILLATGFYVGGYAETDGPCGTAFLALALKELGFCPVVITDTYAKGFFELKGVDVLYMPFEADQEWCRRVLNKYRPSGLISIERCGKNSENEYANMRGVVISAQTAKIDMLFELAKDCMPTIGVGDGGNEIGMGNVASVVSEKLSLKPCVVKVDQLVIATVSNWGAYAIIAYLEKLTGQKLLMSFEDVEDYISKTVEIGSVDGVLKKRTVSVDGFGMEIEKEIIHALEMLVC